jgi:hydroxymethylglutaryl-CoA lyase
MPLRLKVSLPRRPQRQFHSSTRLAADHVRIVEVGPRDGLQNEKSTISVETKIELIERLAKTGITHMEAGSFVPAKWVPQVGLFISHVVSGCAFTAAIISLMTRC